MNSRRAVVRMQAGSKQGSKHIRLGLNNQDARLAERFSVPAFDKDFRVGIVSDGCTGFPTFSRTEVGSNLLVLYAYRRIQEMVCSGMSVHEVAKALFPGITEFLWDLANKIMPPNIVWPYPVTLKKREGWTSQTRFQIDYLAATMIGFLDDGEDVIVFSSGDGIILVNDDIVVIDQNDQPQYPVISVNQATKGFDIKFYKTSNVRRLAVMTDGLKELVKSLSFVDSLFTHLPDQTLGLQFLLNTTFENSQDVMSDDCTVVTWEKQQTS